MKTRVEIRIDAERLQALVEEMVHVYRDRHDHSPREVAEYTVARAKAVGSTMLLINVAEKVRAW